MNKKGFTLIEVIVSVVLVSIVMVSLTATLVEIKKKSISISGNTDALIYSSIISRTINSDLALHNGIKFIECKPNGEKCGLVLGDNKKRSIKIIDSTDGEQCNVSKNGNGYYYRYRGSGNSPTSVCNGLIEIVIPQTSSNAEANFNGCEVKANCLAATYDLTTQNCTCFKERISSTLLYSDISEDTGSVVSEADGDIVYTKTLSYVRTYNEKNNQVNVTTEGFGFSRLYNNQDTFKNKENDSNSALTSLTIGIYDGIDKNDATYNVVLYSGATIKKNVDASVGQKFTITFDVQGNLALPNRIRNVRMCRAYNPSGECDITASNPINSIVEVFNIGFNSTHINQAGDNSTVMNTITKIDFVPCITISSTALDQSGVFTCDEASNIVFKGFYTEKTESTVNNGGGALGTVKECKGARVIDSEGRIIAPSNYFSNNTKVYACWNTK